MEIKHDKFILGQSKSKAIDENSKEIRFDLQLQKKAGFIGIAVEGTVTDTSGPPIPNALIKITDSNLEAIMHTITNDEGSYVFNNIPANDSYTIFAIAEDKKLKQDKQFALSGGGVKTIDFILEDDIAMQLGIIAGDLYKNGTDAPISGAVLSLYKNVNNAEVLVAITNTNEYGQFVFREVDNGQYKIEISALGFISENMTVEMALNASKIMSIKPNLNSDTNAENGIISGIIMNDTNTPINRADVILYKVNKDDANLDEISSDNRSLTPVAFTKTNISGIYLFINVPQGIYKVKSNKIELVEVEVTTPLKRAPNINSLTLSQATTINPISTEAKFGILENGAVIRTQSNSPGFIDLIGGLSQGTVTLSINAPLTGKYNINLEHLNSSVRFMTLEVNGVDGESLAVPGTKDFYTENSEIFTTEIDLIQGKNIIKLKGNTTYYAPVIGKITFTIKSIEGKIELTKGTLRNGVIIKEHIGESEFVGNIGSTSNGFVTISLDIPIEGNYKIEMPHLNEEDRTLTVDVNGLFLTKYDVPPTKDYNASNAKILKFDATFVKGLNTIRFHNDNENLSAPLLGTLKYVQD